MVDRQGDRGYMLSLSLFDYTDDVMAARDRPIDFSDITGWTFFYTAWTVGTIGFGFEKPTQFED